MVNESLRFRQKDIKYLAINNQLMKIETDLILHPEVIVHGS